METFLGIVILLFVGFMVFLFIEAPGIAVTIIVVPVAIIITVITIKNIIQKKKQSRTEAGKEKKRNDEIRKEAELKRQKILAQQSLVKKYKSSEQLAYAMDYLCGAEAARRLPDTIRIDNEGIVATSNGQRISFNFVQHRLPKLPVVSEGGTCYYEQYIIRPQVAIAEAINNLLSYEYDIRDNAKTTYTKYDDEEKFTWRYVSDYVIMTLKPKYSF